MSACAPVPTLQPDERADLLSLLAGAARPLAGVVSDFLARFPRERRLRVGGALCFLLEASCGPSLPTPSPSLLPPSSLARLLRFVRLGGGFRGGKRIGGQLELAGLGFASGSQIRWVLGSPRWLGGYFSLEGSGANWDELCCCVLAIPLADLGSGFRWTGGLFGRADICGFWRLLARHLSVFLRMSSEF